MGRLVEKALTVVDCMQNNATIKRKRKRIILCRVEGVLKTVSR